MNGADVMDCNACAEQIAALVEARLPLRERQEVEAHLAVCRDCAGLVEDLILVRRGARGLADLAPSPAAHARTAAAVARTGRWRAPRLVPVAWRLAAAAVLLIGLAAVTWRAASRVEPEAGPAPAPQVAAADATELLGSVESELQLAEQHYENAVAALEKLVADQQVLDPAVAQDLQRNLAVIDRAIGESRAALKAQPTSEPARDSLFEAFRSKVALLQDTIALINEMRKGNQAGAARIAETLNKS